MEQVTSGTAAGQGVPAIEIDYGSSEYLDALVAMHMRHFTGAEHLGVLLGTAFVRDTYSWFLTSSNAFVLVAKEGERIVGYTSVSDEPYDRALIQACRKSMFRGLLVRPWLLCHREIVNRILQSIKISTRRISARKTAQIAFTVVEKDRRGMGIGSRLKQESIRICMERGATDVITGVRRENTASRRMNESAGFELLSPSSTGRMLYYRLSGGDKVRRGKQKV